MLMTGDPDWGYFLETEAQVRFVAVGEHRLRVVEIGEGEPVLLVHGFVDSAYTWHRNLRALAAAGFCALAYDHPGCGESALPPAFRFGADGLARLAVELLDAFDIERAHLVGSSMGGGIGLHMAAHHPGRLRRVVLVEPTCYHAPFRPFVYLFRCSLFRTLTHSLSGPWLVRPVLRSQYSDPALLTPQVLAQYRSAFRRPEYLHACAGLLRDYWNHAFAETARSYREIGVPLHLVWGERDTWVDTHYALRLAADTGADLTVIAGAGHLVHQARPMPFNEAVVRFLGAER
jgi:pimeloyl-ACP methyl ester carboxylesterase